MTMFGTYGEAHERFRIIATKAEFYMYKVTVPLFTIPAIIQSYMKYYATGSADTSFRLALDATLPYNWKTPTTYFVTMIFQFVAFANTAAVYAISYIMFFGICKYLVALNDDYRQSLDILDEHIKNPLVPVSELKLRLHQLIQLHAVAKELSTIYLAQTLMAHQC